MWSLPLPSPNPRRRWALPCLGDRVLVLKAVLRLAPNRSQRATYAEHAASQSHSDLAIVLSQVIAAGGLSKVTSLTQLLPAGWPRRPDVDGCPIVRHAGGREAQG